MRWANPRQMGCMLHSHLKDAAAMLPLANRGCDSLFLSLPLLLASSLAAPGVQIR
jgi:hypothetical protein